jgi:hypothetical protein
MANGKLKDSEDMEQRATVLDRHCERIRRLTISTKYTARGKRTACRSSIRTLRVLLQSSL